MLKEELMAAKPAMEGIEDLEPTPDKPELRTWTWTVFAAAWATMWPGRRLPWYIVDFMIYVCLVYVSISVVFTIVLTPQGGRVQHSSS